MNFDTIPDALQTRMRVSILSVLYNGEKDFNTMKELLHTTDGNLGVQLTKLELYNCITSTKTLEKGKRRTIYAITDHGKRIFTEYVEMLQKSINGG